MPEPIHDTRDPYIVGLLNLACSDPAYVKVGFGGRVIGEGYSTYRVVTHCTVVTYTAKVIDRDHNGWPTRYRIIHRDYEPC